MLMLDALKGDFQETERGELSLPGAVFIIDCKIGCLLVPARMTSVSDGRLIVDKQLWFPPHCP